MHLIYLPPLNIQIAYLSVLNVGFHGRTCGTAFGYALVFQTSGLKILGFIETQYKTVLSLSPESSIFPCVRPPEIPTSGMVGRRKNSLHLLNPGLLHATLLIAKRCITKCWLSHTPLHCIWYLNN